MSQLLAPRFQKERIHPQLSAYFMGIIGSVSYIDFYYLVLPNARNTPHFCPPRSSAALHIMKPWVSIESRPLTVICGTCKMLTEGPASRMIYFTSIISTR
jgi:hypothetical protein